MRCNRWQQPAPCAYEELQGIALRDNTPYLHEKQGF